MEEGGNVNDACSSCDRETVSRDLASWIKGREEFQLEFVTRRDSAETDPPSCPTPSPATFDTFFTSRRVARH